MKESTKNMKKRENSKNIARSGDVKQRKQRTEFSPEVLEKLIHAYETGIKPSEELAESLNLTSYVVKTWFHNKKGREQRKLLSIT